MKAATGIDLGKRLQEIADMPDEKAAGPASDRIQPSAKPGKSGKATKKE